MSQASAVLKVTPPLQERIKNISDQSDTTIKDATKAILDWALPHFEEGGDLEVTKVAVRKKDSKSAT